MIYFAAALVAYLLGSIPFGFVAGLIAGVDVRKHGSGNIGATNTLRVLGKKYGYPVFVADVLKGFLAVRIALWLTRFDPSTGDFIGILAAFFVVVGHSFPIWLRFRGGKGVAAAAGACLGLVPLATLIAVLIWIVTFFIFRYVSLASIVAAIALALSALFLGYAADPILLTFTCLIAALIILRHRSNIMRLLQGREPRFDRK
ncbi:MAG TPA: glycerol-3-phosphate 1-O-acyltransferase PlsY [Chthoniobacterales bacterium]|nr:glycerol-3-phosphate 1-O-acyltransferase PlsY [Chthoniobacterales bacterium]